MAFDQIYEYITDWVQLLCRIGHSLKPLQKFNAKPDQIQRTL